jgi:hypothetical protein
VTAWFVGRFSRVTLARQPVQVVPSVVPTWDVGKDRVDFCGVALHAIQTARAPFAPVLVQEPGHAWGRFPMAASACPPIYPVPVIRTAGALHWPMALMACGGLADQASPGVGWREGPALSLVHPPVLAHAPGLGLVRVPGDGPAPEPRRAGVVQLLAHPSALDGRLRATPTTHQGVAGFAQRLVLRGLVAGAGGP